MARQDPAGARHQRDKYRRTDQAYRSRRVRAGAVVRARQVSSPPRDRCASGAEWTPSLRARAAQQRQLYSRSSGPRGAATALATAGYRRQVDVVSGALRTATPAAQTATRTATTLARLSTRLCVLVRAPLDEMVEPVGFPCSHSSGACGHCFMCVSAGGGIEIAPFEAPAEHTSRHTPP